MRQRRRRIVATDLRGHPAAAKPAEVEQKTAGLRTVRETLLQAVAAGYDDLAACAASPRRPLPFAEPDEGERVPPTAAGAPRRQGGEGLENMDFGGMCTRGWLH
ncbi:hypothetical protein [Planobispora takensis]|uniref:hypothetical protein n=1 Tax=Planobispora takensis TaxID=1367882 RepID=UPI001940B6DA|nr:hypothetical protein [Planobispora takensis]